MFYDEITNSVNKNCSPALSGGSKNGTLKTNKSNTPTAPPVSPTLSSADSELDVLLKSLAKETLSGIQRDESRNEMTHKSEDSDSERQLKSLPAELPNNITKYTNNTMKPIPPSQLKCNILKAKVEEELNAGTPIGVATKLTNQMFVAAANEETNLNSLGAATFVSVVSVVFL